MVRVTTLRTRRIQYSVRQAFQRSYHQPSYWCSQQKSGRSGNALGRAVDGRTDLPGGTRSRQAAWSRPGRAIRARAARFRSRAAQLEVPASEVAVTVADSGGRLSGGRGIGASAGSAAGPGTGAGAARPGVTSRPRTRVATTSAAARERIDPP